jgi:hypothetical protein
MGQWRNDAALEDAQPKLRKEEYALDMEHRSNYVVMQDAKINP